MMEEVHHEDITVINVYTPHYRSSNVHKGKTARSNRKQTN